MKKSLVFTVLSALIATLCIVGCSNGSGGGGGGSGADFDASLYYTKANIDNYIKDAAPKFVFANAAIAPANST
jgi:hypothetical protein